MMNVEQLLQISLNRREFLVKAATVGSALALGSAVSSNRVEYQEDLIPVSNTATFDFVSEYSTPGHVRYSYINTLSRIRKMLGPSYNIPIWQLFREFGPHVFTEDGFKALGLEYPEYGAVAGGMLAFAPHGSSVTHCQTQFARKFGYDFVPQAFSVQEGLTIKKLHHVDNLNNPSVLLHMSAEPVREQLRNLPYLPIVNISLQFGTLAITHKRAKIQERNDTSLYESLQQSLLTFYEKPNGDEYIFYDPAFYFVDDNEDEPILKNITTGEHARVEDNDYRVVSAEHYNDFIQERKRTILEQTLHVEAVDTSKRPFYEIQGAYKGEYRKENIQELFSLAYDFPEKLFVVAAGNYGDDITTLREEFSHDWPENLIIVGHWDSALQYPRMFGTYDIFGADFYVDPKPYTGESGSSMATAVVSSAASLLKSRGYMLQEIKAKLAASCDELIIERKPEIPYGSIDIEDYINAELNKTQEIVNVFNETKFRQILFESVV